MGIVLVPGKVAIGERMLLDGSPLSRFGLLQERKSSSSDFDFDKPISGRVLRQVIDRWATSRSKSLASPHDFRRRYIGVLKIWR